MDNPRRVSLLPNNTNTGLSKNVISNSSRGHLFPVLSYSLSYCCVKWIQSGNVITLSGKKEPIAFLCFTLQKQVYSNILKILPPKSENIQIKIFVIFLISAQNRDCGYSLAPPRRGGSNEYPQFIFSSQIKK